MCLNKDCFLSSEVSVSKSNSQYSPYRGYNDKTILMPVKKQMTKMIPKKTLLSQLHKGRTTNIVPNGAVTMKY